MNWAIEFHDSTYLGLELRGTAVFIILKAYLHETTGEPGVDAGTGWTQRLELQIADAQILGSLRVGEWLSDGEARIGDVEYMNILPLPAPESRPVSMRLEADGEELKVRGAHLTVIERGPRRWVEQFTP